MGLHNFFKKKGEKMHLSDNKLLDIKTYEEKDNRRKTIPKEIKELVKDGKDEEVKKIMAKCRINAYDTYSKNTILSYEGISDDLVRFFIQEGYDINYRGAREETPLYVQAGNLNANLRLLIALDADIHALDYMGKSPLHHAAMFSKLENIKVLIEAGADVNLKSQTFQMTPLHELVARMYLFNAQTSIACIHYLLGHGAKITEEIKETIKKIGKDYEFHRDESKEITKEMDETLHTLYDIFNVTPVEHRKRYDGVAKIQVTSNRWQDQHEELWQLLVPGDGHANTIQGELTRIAGKLSYEIIDNGAVNWDHDYRLMVESILSILHKEKSCQMIKWKI